jgi:16S rRNA (adenine1518-N6/adenine1519-N6)-dimethyltransferase
MSVPLQKRLGQHHLVQPGVCRPLVDFLAPAGERVVEIGPGGGVLTGELLAAGARVIGLELDPAWAFELGRRMAAARGLRLVVADALEVPWERLPAPTLVAGNLPYNVGTAILERLLPHHAVVPRAAFLLQKEVAERLVARPGDAAYGALSVLVQARAEARLLGRVRPGSFRPPPKVESAFVGLLLEAPPLPEAEMPAFTALVRLAFGQRRKTLRNSLAGSKGLAGWGLGGAEAVLAAAGISPRARAEELGLEDFLRLYRCRES